MISGLSFEWWAQPESNRASHAYKARALPLSYAPNEIFEEWCERKEFALSQPKTGDLRQLCT
jgi:hypothetical protein